MYQMRKIEMMDSRILRLTIQPEHIYRQYCCKDKDFIEFIVLVRISETTIGIVLLVNFISCAPRKYETNDDYKKTTRYRKTNRSQKKSNSENDALYNKDFVKVLLISIIFISIKKKLFDC